MTLTELINEVYVITGRSDLVNDTLSAVKAATLKAHHSDFYWKDVFESGVQFDTAEYVQTFDYRNIVPRWRAAKYFRKYDNINAVPGKFLDPIPPELVLDRYASEKTNVYYGAGAYLTLKSDTAEQYYLMGCYLHPDITTAAYNSWIALDHPFAIIYEAAGKVFAGIGKDEEAARYANPQNGFVAEQIALLKMSNIGITGY